MSSRTLAVMGIESAIEVVVEIEYTSETICGQIRIADRSPTTFFGWLELIDQLERAATGRPPERPLPTTAFGRRARQPGTKDGRAYPCATVTGPVKLQAKGTQR
jgi:hypothetical protein